jgi:hypothetical protein
MVLKKQKNKQGQSIFNDWDGRKFGKMAGTLEWRLEGKRKWKY